METVKGFRDYTGEDAEKREAVRRILVETLEKYGFQPAENPIVEYEEFVKGDNEKDEAVSDIFKLKDKGARALALRYELTFQLKRIMQNKKLPYKRYEIGPVFRDEPVQGNRLRQFTQADSDIIGMDSPRDEAEIIILSSEVMKKLGIDAIINVNSRELINEVLEEQGVKSGDREEVIKIIDKLDKKKESEITSELKQFNAERVLEIFTKNEKYFKKYKSYSQIEEIRKYCNMAGVIFNFLPTLARGLSYYNKAVYEIKTKQMKETITGGGSYMFNGIQCTGISFGIERLCQLAKINLEKEKFLIISLNQDKKSIEITQKLREKGKIATIYYGRPSKALEFANAYNYNKIVFVGDKEIKSRKFKVKDMKIGKESAFKI